MTMNRIQIHAGLRRSARLQNDGCRHEVLDSTGDRLCRHTHVINASPAINAATKVACVAGLASGVLTPQGAPLVCTRYPTPVAHFWTDAVRITTQGQGYPYAVTGFY